ncbi:hypothetical protein [Rubripirellula reticaptiva]|uniref:Uncharacterized protein n=1 Tax=Rubripirellula reticaptiva TaxID=2528013 RepID=A0A5C6FDQ3_9BACT|nr:hypothetical protein [Rubripirellula reticaptiva]TWU58334.1 hypothetical protein Poly59_12450 [Rubripirellula reticaptiva]
MPRRLVSLARATRKSGGWTWFAAAHFSFSVSLWQQHLSQQKSAVEQPQAQSSHGKRPCFGVGGDAIGSPNNPHVNTTNSSVLMARRGTTGRA